MYAVEVLYTFGLHVDEFFLDIFCYPVCVPELQNYFQDRLVGTYSPGVSLEG